MNAIPKAVREATFRQMQANGEELANAMKSAAEKRSGALAATIRVETKQTDIRDQVFVRAGGPRTTKSSPGSKPYDYARALEFGRQGQSAEPFFWPVVRLMRRSLRRKLSKAMRQAAEREFS